MTIREALDAALPIVTGPFAGPAAAFLAGEVKKEVNDQERAALKTFITDLGNAL